MMILISCRKWHQRNSGRRDGFGQDFADDISAWLHEASEERQRSPHGFGAQVNPSQLDERVQKVVSHHQGRLPHR